MMGYIINGMYGDLFLISLFFFCVCFALVGGCCGSSSVLCVWFVIYACLCVCVCVCRLGRFQVWAHVCVCVSSQNCQPSCSQVRSLFRTCHAVVKCFVSENMILTRASGDTISSSFVFCILEIIIFFLFWQRDLVFWPWLFFLVSLKLSAPIVSLSRLWHTSIHIKYMMIYRVKTSAYVLHAKCGDVGWWTNGGWGSKLFQFPLIVYVCGQQRWMMTAEKMTIKSAVRSTNKKRDEIFFAWSPALTSLAFSYDIMPPFQLLFISDDELFSCHSLCVFRGKGNYWISFAPTFLSHTEC